MSKGAGSWLAGHAVELVTAVAGFVGTGAIMTLRDEVMSLWGGHAWGMLAWSLLCVAGGAALGDSRGMSRYRRARHEERVAAERAEQDAEARREADEARRRDGARRRVLGLSYYDKLLVSKVSRDGFLDTGQGCDEEDVRELIRGISDLVCSTEVRDRVWRIRLTDYGRYAVSVSGDIIDEAVRP